MTWKNHFRLSGWSRLSVFGQAVEFEARLVLSSLDDGDVSMVNIDANSVVLDERFFPIETEGELQDAIDDGEREEVLAVEGFALVLADPEEKPVWLSS